MERTDILLDENNDYLAVDGDFAVGKSDEQHVSLLLSSTPGSWRRTPLVGVGLVNFAKKQNVALPEMRRAIEVNLKADGYQVKNISSGGEFTLDYEANY